MVEYKKATHVPAVNADEPVISAVVANMNANEVSAPIKGSNGVYVVKVTAKNAKNGTFNAEAENLYITSNGGMFSYDNIAGQLLQMAISNIYPAENKLHTMQMAQ
jgi:parvulin-like peptidyl-prolyl isomerase